MSAGEILGSLVVVALISGGVSYLVALTTRKTTIEMAQMESVEKDRERSREAFIASIEAWGMSRLEDADDLTRRAKVTEARRHLIEVGAIMGNAVRSGEFDQLIDCMGEGDAEGLSKAASLWPGVERAIMGALPRAEVQRTRRQFGRRG
jgi:hypothetical protein